MFIGYSEFHEKDVYKFWHLSTNKTLISRDVIWLNKTYSDDMNITKVNFITSEVEEEEDGEEEEQDEELLFDLPSTAEEDHTEQLVDTTTASKPSIVPAPYPKSKRELRSLSYGAVRPN
jgi:hypothetical protein